jgi:hypothetical protein
MHFLTKLSYHAFNLKINTEIMNKTGQQKKCIKKRSASLVIFHINPSQLQPCAKEPPDNR